MKIVIDTNILFSDISFKDKYLNYITKFLERTETEILITEINIDELIGNIEEKSNEEQKVIVNTFDKSRLLLSYLDKEKFMNNINEELNRSREKFINDYKQMLNRFIKMNNVEIIEYPNIGHKEIIKRMYENKVPFNGNNREKGYKDYLIIKSIEEWKNKSGYADTVYLITRNTIDFCGIENSKLKDGAIQLSEDYDCKGIEVFKDIKSFYEFSKSKFEIKILDKKIDIPIYTLAIEKYFNADVNHLYDFIFELLFCDVTEYRVRILKEIGSGTITEVFDVFETEFVFHFQIYIKGVMDKFSYENLDILKRFFDELLKKKSISFDDYNTRYNYALSIDLRAKIQDINYLNNKEDIYDLSNSYFVISEIEIIN